MYFPYGDTETEYLKQRDPVLAEVIDTLGHIDREMDEDIYSALVHHIVAQQISAPALKTVWQRMLGRLGTVTPENVYALTPEELQSFGITFRKAGYIRELTEKVLDGTLDIARFPQMSDEEVIRELSALRGIGVWTAEMLLLFAMGRKDILAFDDLAIQKGMRMVYHHRRITRKLYRKYKKRWSPYNSVASLYLWRVAAGGIEGMKDPAPKRKKRR